MPYLQAILLVKMTENDEFLDLCLITFFRDNINNTMYQFSMTFRCQ